MQCNLVYLFKLSCVPHKVRDPEPCCEFNNANELESSSERSGEVINQDEVSQVKSSHIKSGHIGSCKIMYTVLFHARWDKNKSAAADKIDMLVYI